MLCHQSVDQGSGQTRKEDRVSFSLERRPSRACCSPYTFSLTRCFHSIVAASFPRPPTHPASHIIHTQQTLHSSYPH